MHPESHSVHSEKNESWLVVNETLWQPQTEPSADEGPLVLMRIESNHFTAVSELNVDKHL